MSIIPIETESEKINNILRAQSQEVTDILSPGIQTLISDMKETLTRASNGIGLAAPQIGKNLRIFVIAPELELNQTVFINPIIVKISSEITLMEEGCLSVPSHYGKINRATSLKVEASNERGRKFKMKADGLIAQLVQHEIDHLDGILFKDKATQIIKRGT